MTERPTTDAAPPVATRAVLAVLCAAQFVLILDIAVVNVALVPLARDLGATPDSLQLVASVYAATFGGALLIGGRIADDGRRHAAFVGGLLLFALASGLCGAAWSVPAVLVGRALQGLGAAFASPAALSLVTATFPEGAERDRALGAWSAVAAAGGAAGLLAGGALTEIWGWRTVFFVNLPIIAVVVVAARRLVAADRPAAAPAVPVASGSAAAAAVVGLVVGLGIVHTRGSAAVAVTVLVAAGALAAAQRVLDRRAPAPLVPTVLLRSRQVLAANAVTALMSTVVLGINFFLAVHLEQRLGFGPVATGVAFLPITVVSATTSLVAAQLVSVVGVRTLLVAGMSSMATGSLLLSGLPAGGGYLRTVMPGLVLVAAGMGPAFAVGTIAATGGVAARQQGAAAALLSSSMQVGAAIGVAVLGVLAARSADPVAGTRTAFGAMAVAAAAAAGCALALPRRGLARIDARRPPPPLVPAQAGGCLPGCAGATGARP